MDDATRQELLGLERALLDSETRHNPGWLDRTLAPEMVEFGKSGRVWDRNAIIAALIAETPAPAPRFEIVSPTVAELAPGVVLVTYRLEPLAEAETASLRASVWLKEDARWRLVFHQGTTAA